MRDSDIPTRFIIPWAASAGSPYIRPIPVASQISITPGAASLTDGFPPVTMQPQASGGVPPFGQDWNGILKQITQWAQWQQAGAPIGYDPTFSSSIGGYPNGAVLASAAGGGNYWISTVDNNASNPDAGGANWNVAGGLSQSAVAGATTTYTQAQNNVQILRSNSGSPMQDVLPGISPGILAAGTVIRVTNTDSAALMSIRPGAGTALSSPRARTVLGPGQSVVIISDGSIYRVVSIANRVLLKSTDTPIYVSGAGNDANDGITASTPLALPGTAYSWVLTEFDLGGTEMVCNVAAGSYSFQTDCHGTLVGQGQGAGLKFIGNIATPSTVNISISAAASFCFGAGGGAKIGVFGFTLQNLTGAILFTDGTGSQIVQGNNVFGVGSIQMSAGNYGAIVHAANYSITQGGGVHCQALNGGSITVGSTAIVVTLSGAPSYSIAFVVAGGLGFLSMPASAVSFGGTGATGTRFNVTLNGVVSSAGGGANFFPGSAAGTTSTGGQYA